MFNFTFRKKLKYKSCFINAGQGITMDNDIKIIFIDLGGTLIDTSSMISIGISIVKDELPEGSVDAEKFILDWKKEVFKCQEFCRSYQFHTIRELFKMGLENVVKEYELALDEDKISNIADKAFIDTFQNLRVFPDVIPTLEKLQKDFDLGIISDADYEVAEALLNKFCIAKYFKIKIISSEYQVYKPDVLLFQKAIELSGYRPSESLYIGDEQVDVDGAKKGGMKCVLINRNSIEIDNQYYQPDHVIDSISDLLGILEKP